MAGRQNESLHTFVANTDASCCFQVVLDTVEVILETTTGQSGEQQALSSNANTSEGNAALPFWSQVICHGNHTTTGH